MKTNGLSEIGFDRQKMANEALRRGMAKESHGPVKSPSRANSHPYEGPRRNSRVTPVEHQELPGSFENKRFIGFDRKKMPGEPSNWPRPRSGHRAPKAKQAKPSATRIVVS
jgi:hypothetical protein